MKNKVCVYAIAKNEEKNAELWYNSMKAADHVIVLDTGSTDRTVEILTSLGCEVHQKIYENFEFNVARNDSLALVPKEYNILICTDIDERFDNDAWADVLREKWIEGQHQRGQYMYTWDHLSDGSDGHTFVYNKIHNHDWHWRDPIHETICRKSDDTREYTTEECLSLENDIDKIHLHHWQDMSQDRMWYVELAEKRLEIHPEDPLTWLELQREYLAKRHFDKCVKLSKKMIYEHRDMFDSLSIASIYHQMGGAYANLELVQEACGAYFAGICADTTYRDNYIDLMAILVNNGLYDSAVGLGNQAIKLTYEHHHWTESSLACSWGIYNNLAAAYIGLNDFEKAYTYINLALLYESGNEHLLGVKKTCEEQLFQPSIEKKNFDLQNNQ